MGGRGRDGGDMYGNRGGRGYGGGRNMRGSDRERGRRGRGGRYGGPEFNPTDNMANPMAGHSHQAQAISKFEKLPPWIKSGGTKETGNENEPVIKKLNKLQEKVFGDLCLGNDSVIISPAGSGKTVALILAGFYRLYTRKAPAHVMFICSDHLHAETLTRVALKLGEDVPDLRVNKQVRGVRPVSDRQMEEGRNLFICSPGKAISLCEDWNLKEARKKLISSLVSVNILDADTLLTPPLFERIQKTFRYIPTNINVNFASNSYCKLMERNLKLLVTLDSPKTKMHRLDHDHDNLKFWFIFSEANMRQTMLKELCKVNPYRQGIIYCNDDIINDPESTWIGAVEDCDDSMKRPWIGTEIEQKGYSIRDWNMKLLRWRVCMMA